MTTAAHPRKRTPAQRVAIGRKWCPRCEADLPFENFHKNRTEEDGRHSLCKECWSAYRQRAGDRNKHLVSAWNDAARLLIERHRPEFDDLYSDAKRGRGL